MTQTIHTLESPETDIEFTEIIVDKPAYLFAALDNEGSLWVYRSSIVGEDGKLYAPVRKWIAEHGMEQVFEDTHEDPSMMFRTAKERLYRVAALVGAFVAVGALSWVFLSGGTRVEHISDETPASTICKVAGQ